MDKIIHSSRLQLIVTPLSFMEPVMQLENHPEHKRFIMPYDKNRHRQCLRSSDEMHLSIVNFHGKFLGFIILAGLNSFSHRQGMPSIDLQVLFRDQRLPQIMVRCF